MTNLKTIIKKIPFLHTIFRKGRLSVKKVRYRKYYSDSESKGRISPKDEMFQGNLEHYENTGRSAVEMIERGLNIEGKKFEDITTMLDMPCGHGRVMRHLVKRLSPSKIVGCDLDPDCVEFCSEEFKCIPLISNIKFEKINFPNKFDLIWVGSLFTHLNKKDFVNLLRVLYVNLNNNGLLVFSAHGNYSLEIIDQYPGIIVKNTDFVKKELEDEGYYFMGYDDSENNGISISPKEFVVSAAEEISSGRFRLNMFEERGWDNHHDVYSFVKN